MKVKVVALTLLVATMGVAVPVMAQTRNPSQDFFEQGRDQLEREIQNLQTQPITLEDKVDTPPSEPLLEVSPAPTNPANEKPNQVETPNQQPSQGDNQEQGTPGQ